MTALLAHGEDHARKLIAVLITECRKGVSDREAEALELAERFKIEKEPISARFATARKLKAEEVAERGGNIAAELDTAIEKAKAKERTAQRRPKPAWPILRMRRLNDPGPAKAQRSKFEPEEAKATSEPSKADPAPASGRIMLPAVVPQPQPPARSDWDEAIAAMNERHAIIDNVGSKTMIASWEPSQLDPSRLEVVFQTLLCAFERGGNRRETMPLGQWWLTIANVANIVE
jgi:hypothetical protein